MIFFSCKSKIEPDTEPPEVEILSPQSAVVANVCSIKVAAYDSSGISRVEIYLDNHLVQTADDSICMYQWDTRNVPDNSRHSIYAKAYDLEDNEGTSDILNVTAFNNLDNTEIFIWLFDQNDVFYDSNINKSIDCSYWLEQTIIVNGYSCDKLTFLPPDLSSYKVGFITLGWERT
ncbi:MAG: Ig-like domain-containing protein [candidate division WOR-3 bacterium]